MSIPRRLLMRVTSAHMVAPALRAFGRGLASIFMLHRFSDRDLGVTGTEPKALRDHLAYLRRHRYRLVGLQDLLAQFDANGEQARPSDAPMVAFTVDDGYGDFVTRGAPIFAEFDCPVTLFVTSGFVDGQIWMWWDRVTYLFAHARGSAARLRLPRREYDYGWGTAVECDVVRQEVIQRLEWVDAPERELAIADLAGQLDVQVPTLPPAEFASLTWGDVRRLAGAGVTYGPHGVTHRILSQAPLDACTWEIEESNRRLRQETDAVVPVFCYPNGGRRAVTEREVLAVARAGLQGAVTAQRGYATASQRFALPRFPYPDDRSHLVHVVAGLARLTSGLRPAQGA